ncbi:uncharacterized protein GGS22DRAFT_14452 [Annulohypoxylon maeteangense]|uniref:uncharacterized protein n=1 Tax=Annulohypoxylon maeteangense TaxID=1927788 RepID=UPI002008BCA6|nr:uncharacterized protein GGS22DRAFT_14452 [Annulohypoxylon maeteangense]KAI0890503.1 hypothetical protein GGS22DRAFT_14452 [Annulohypoxylon maeteangense]
MAPGGISTRQKSCNACVKSKRRCDKQIPSCGNCLKRRFPCSYGGKSAMQSHSNSASGSSSGSVASPPAVYESSSALHNGFSAIFDMDLDFPDATLHFDGALESLLNSMADNQFNDTDKLSGLLGRDAQTGPSSTSKSLSRIDYSKIAPVCDDFEPWQLTDPSTRICYIVNVLKNFHTTFAQYKSTIYMHGQLYASNPPRWILQAFATCVLYTSQTAATRGFVLKILQENVNNLIHTASGTSFTPREKLARVHALMAYQTIRMFDGDIALNQQAQNDMPIMEAWNEELRKIRDNLNDVFELDMIELRKKQPESWERWLFAESVRRTYIIGLALRTFWDLLRDQGDESDFGNWEYIHRWTLSRHLWAAQNSFDFWRAWNEKPMWVINAFCFDEFLRTGKGDDIDDLALVFLVLSFGLDEVKTFCYETSRRLLE